MRTFSSLLYIHILYLGMFSLLFGCLGVAISDWKAVNEKGIFQGYCTIVLIVILLQVHMYVRMYVYTVCMYVLYVLVISCPGVLQQKYSAD